MGANDREKFQWFQALIGELQREWMEDVTWIIVAFQALISLKPTLGFLHFSHLLSPYFMFV